ncbi:MAG TPA: glycosyltransferase family 4 protein, partial [Candidatus Krumholzibacteria bacterium]|nr:glycosyltransferase family 4 protein [Candidatus Krumholzibacteria bacterium]
IMKLFGVEELSRSDESPTRHLRRNAEMIIALKIPHDLWIVLDDGTGGDEALRRHGVASDRIRFLPNGVTLAWADAPADGNAFRERYNLPAGTPVILWLARQVAWKRGEDAIRAFARARAVSGRPMVLVMGGDGPERGRLEALARLLGVNEHVRFAGAIAHDAVPDAMAAAALFLATAERSNKSIATCEAMLCGVPVVAYDVGGTNHVVREGETGRLVAFDDVDGLAEAMAGLIDDGAARQRLADGARAFARARFTDWERRVEMERLLIEQAVRAGQDGAANPE